MRPCVILLHQNMAGLTLFTPPRKAKGEIQQFNEFEREREK